MSFQLDIANEAVFKAEVLDVPGTLQVIEVYQGWCGPCKAIQSTFKKLFFDLNDRPLKFYTVCADKVPFLKEYVGKSIPVFLLYKDGAQVNKIVGVVAPALQQTIVDLSAPKAAQGA